MPLDTKNINLFIAYFSSLIFFPTNNTNIFHYFKIIMSLSSSNLLDK